MFKRMVAFALTFTFVLVSLPGPSQAQQRKERMGRLAARAPVALMAPLSPQETRSIAKQLNLTPEQQKKMEEVYEKATREMKALRDDYERGLRDLLSLIKEPAPDANVANQQLKEFHRVHQTLLNKEVEYWRDFKTILTPQQNSQFWNLFEEKRLGIRQRGPGEPKETGEPKE